MHNFSALLDRLEDAGPLLLQELGAAREMLCATLTLRELVPSYACLFPD